MDLSSLERHAVSAETFLTGTCIHLWYLPYAFVCGFFVYVSTAGSRRSMTLRSLSPQRSSACSSLAACHGEPARHTPADATAASVGVRSGGHPPGAGRGTMPGGPIPSRAQSADVYDVCDDTGGMCHSDVSAASLRLRHSLTAWRSCLVCLAYGWPMNDQRFHHHCGAADARDLSPSSAGHAWVAALLPIRRALCRFHILAACISGAVTGGLMQTPLRRFI